MLIDLSNTTQLDNVPRWLPLKEQSEGEHHRRSHSGQGRQHSPKPPGGHGSQHSPKTSSHGKEDSPKSSVIKSRSHGIFPDPAKGRTASRMALLPLHLSHLQLWCLPLFHPSIAVISMHSVFSSSLCVVLDFTGSLHPVFLKLPSFGFSHSIYVCSVHNGAELTSASLQPPHTGCVRATLTGSSLLRC